MNRFLAELKRRHVVRAALVYIGAAFVLLQAADLFVEAFQLPPVVFATIGIASIVGLPVAVILAWAFDVEPTLAESAGSPAPAAGTWLSARSLIAVVALVAFGVLLGLAPHYFFDAPEGHSDAAIRRYEILLPEHAPVEFFGSSPLAVPTQAFAITPDGNRLVYVGTAEDAGTRLYVRDLSAFEVRPLPGSEGAYAPFVSPDGKSVGFFAQDQLRIVPIGGGEARIIVETPNPQGGAWWGQDRIIYNDREGAAHWWVPVTGGSPTRLNVRPLDERAGGASALGSEYQPLADGERFLVYVQSGQVAAFTPATGELRTVLDIAVNTRVAADALVYAYGNELFALDFDADDATVSGEPRLVGADLRRDSQLAQFVVSNQTLIYATGVPYGQLHLAIADGKGNIERLDLPPARYGAASFSPDGRRLAITIMESQPDVWIFDLETLNRRRLTRGGANSRPHWSADGDRIYFSSDRHAPGQTTAIYRTSPADAPGDAELVLARAQNLFIDQLHPSDRATVNALATDVSGDMHLADLRSGDMVAVAARDNVAEALGALSPDGRWLAFTADASGRYEIFLKSVDGDSDQWLQVTTDGGEEPLWESDMSEIFYRYGHTLYSVSVSLGAGSPTFGRATPIFEDASWENIGGYSFWRNPADGRFLILRADDPPTSRSLRVVEGWKHIKQEMP